MANSLFQYIKEHLNEDEVFTPATLPDRPHETISRPLGSEDAAIYTMNMPANEYDASRLLKMLRNYQHEPVQPRRQELYRTLKSMMVVSCFDPFIDAFDSDDMTYAAYDLARRFFYNAVDREPLKFALLLFGIHGMERIQSEEPQLWRDIVTVAHCEEFTFPFLFACRMANFYPHKEIWELVGCTHGWGKVFAVIDCHCTNEAERRWLLLHGPELDVEYPPLSVKLLQETQLAKALEQPLEYPFYKSAVAIVGNYLVMLTSFPPDVIAEQFNLSSIYIYPLLTNLLKQAERFLDETGAPEYAIDVLTVCLSLRQLEEEENYTQLTANECQLLLGECDKIIYSKDWQQEISENLIVDDAINYQICDLAYELEYDIWQPLYEYWLQHPHEYALFPYLLSYEGGERSATVISKIIALLQQYAQDEDALTVPMRYLAVHPGKGEAILCAALTGLYYFSRGIACNVLDAWLEAGQQLSPELRNALRQARKLSQNMVVTARIDALLEGKSFSLQQFLDEGE